MNARLLACLIFGLVSVSAMGAEPIDFARQIQPIFAARCTECHGPDSEEGGFRIDRRDSVVGTAESGSVPISPGQVTKSEVIARIASEDEDQRMPPEGEPLTKQEIRLITEWISQGAKYNLHWAYRPLRRPVAPVGASVAGADSPIDAFVFARLRAAGIEPSRQADRYTLIRRLYYDLIGLPPAIEHVDAFVQDGSHDAYERLVDQLLASPRFGERWGRHWLDKARYADSDGYEKDNARPDAWHYRDWVIRALNADLPFDEFTVEQLAGDLLPAATDAQKLATAFHRQTLTNTEGGTDREQWRVAAVMDRTETLGTVWLGLTVGCARCHNHKYDQLTQQEYYQLFAFFNNGDESTQELTIPSGKKTKVRTITERTKDVRTTHVMRRGDFLQPEEPVQADTLATLPARSTASTGDRLELARWLVDGNNPLPPRVAVNHVWQSLFGYGLVRTVNDFGIRGEPPTHPDLLEWLATEFVRRNWSTKQLIRAIVLSHTYRQASVYRDALATLDPTNRLLHRQNRFRVEAEIIRDIALAAAGLLNTRIGGPSVFPPIPPSVTDLTYNSGFKWTTSEGEDRYRRGMYTFFKRTAPHPNLTTFDCPSSNITNVQRERSDTPIAALVTLNNTVYVEAARAMARRLISIDGDDNTRLRWLWRRCVSRPPSEAETARLRALLWQAKEYYQQHPEEARELARNQEPANAVAAWMATSRVVLNLDEFINRE